MLSLMFVGIKLLEQCRCLLESAFLWELECIGIQKYTHSNNNWKCLVSIRPNKSKNLKCQSEMINSAVITEVKWSDTYTNIGSFIWLCVS